MLTRPLCNSEPTHHPPRGGWFDSWIDVTAAIAEGKRPATFRTRKLSPPAPMVLHPRECGRVGRRRTITTQLRAAPYQGRPSTAFGMSGLVPHEEGCTRELSRAERRPP